MGQKLLCPHCKKTVIEWHPNPYDDALICNECYWREHFEQVRFERDHPIGSFLQTWSIQIAGLVLLIWYALATSH